MPDALLRTSSIGHITPDAATAVADSPPQHAPRARIRIDSVDLLRGVIMVIMALDHTRDYFGNAAVNPTDLATTSAGLFLTRWITHFCAPVFFLLSGTGAYLTGRRRSTGNLSRFLVTRGLWLVFLELTVLRFIEAFNIDYHVTVLTVLWALGWSMVALGALVWLPLGAIVTIGAAMVVGHNALDGIAPAKFGALAPVWTVLHSPGPLIITPKSIVLLSYPLIPWIGVMALGYALGPVFAWTVERRRAFLLRWGIGLTIAFIGLRGLNVYGDPRPWTQRASDAFTFLSFLNVTKYPPSLLFLLMTLGPALLFLRALDGRTPRALRPALIFGRVPMFYFLLHFLMIHLLATLVCYVRFGGVHWLFESPTLDKFPFAQPPGWPASLPWVYVAWATVVLLAYPCCRWYASYKARHSSVWLSYL